MKTKKLNEQFSLIVQLGGFFLFVFFPNSFAQEKNSEVIFEECHTKNYFCCEVNGKEVGVVKPENIWGAYNYESALNYCEKKFGASLSINTDEFIQIPEKPEQDPLEDLDNSFHEID